MTNWDLVDRILIERIYQAYQSTQLPFTPITPEQAVAARHEFASVGEEASELFRQRAKRFGTFIETEEANFATLFESLHPEIVSSQGVRAFDRVMYTLMRHSRSGINIPSPRKQISPYLLAAGAVGVVGLAGLGITGALKLPRTASSVKSKNNKSNNKVNKVNKAKSSKQLSRHK